MKVYEMIQELTRYDADTEVQFHVKAEYLTDVKADFDRENENDMQEVTVDAKFDEYVDFDEIRQHYYDEHKVIINLKY